jgi:5-methylcytosine-specific restriction endonuclease McrA
MKTPTIGPVRLSVNYGKPSIYKDPAKKRKQRQEKAKKTLAKLAAQSPEIQKLISQRAYTISKKKTKKEKPVGLHNAPIYQKSMGSDFYMTKEWRQVRYSVFVKYGKICMCCGTKDGYLHVDHIKPRSKFPELELEISNLQVLCEACNVGKSNLDQTDWRR